MAQKVDTTKLQCSRLFSVEGWVCLITGGGTGIGLMCAQALATNGWLSRHISEWIAPSLDADPGHLQEPRSTSPAAA